MEESRLFAKGMHSDYDSQNQPEHTYTYAINWVRNLDGSLSSEKGTKLFCTGFPDKNIIGSLTINNTIVFFLEDESGSHEIGYVDVRVGTSVYTSKLIHTDLNFSKDKLVRARGRVDYRGHKLVYFVDDLNPNRVLDLDKDYSGVSDIKGELKLQLDSKLPETKFVSVNPDGELKTGIYQLQARLLTSSGNKSMVGLPTNPIPIIDDTGDTKLADGAPPQSDSAMSITIEVSNIDQKYKFIEIIACTYEGVSNILRAYVVGRRQIVGTTMNFTYYSNSQIIEEVSVDEVTVEPVLYESGKLIEYKDGHLMIAGLKSRKEGDNFQKVANSITANYVIKEIPYLENIDSDGQVNREDLSIADTAFNKRQGYDIESNTVVLKGMRRDEVYSLSITPIYKNGTTGFAYHIPARAATTRTPARPLSGTNGGQCGTYLSEETYPTGFGYPTGKVRHHVMPSISQEPFYKDGKIRVLGLKLNGIRLDVLTADERENLAGYIIGYQQRSSIHKSILTQGIVNPLARRNEGNELFVAPFNGKGPYLWGDSISWRTANSDNATTSVTYFRDTLAFYSPESVIYGEEFNADWIDAVDRVTGKGIPVAAFRGDDNNSGRGHEFANFFMNFNTHVGYSKSSTKIHKDTITQVPFQQGTMKFTPPNFKLAGRTLSLKRSNGYLFMHTEQPVPIHSNSSTSDTVSNVAEISYDLKGKEPSDIYFVRGNTTVGINNSNNKYYSDVSRLIYNLRADRPRQYGAVSDATYVYLAHDINLRDNIEIFNGDTFISKFAVMSTTCEPHASDESKIDELKFYTLNYVMVESDINMSYRHYVSSTNIESGTVPYFPKYRSFWSKEGQNGLFQVNPDLGHSTGYNRQYSFANAIKKFVPRPLLLEEEVTDFSNRVMYSEVSLEGEQFDANRLFLPNSYHDIPKHKGKITDMFVHNGTMYLHTPQTLFRTFINEQTAIVTNSGEVYTGNGGLFPRPSLEVFTINGGYAGSSSNSGVNTPFGRVFIDEIQGKVFLFSDKVNEISLQGMVDFFRTNLLEEEDTLTKGYTATYDYNLRRYILSCKGKWTVSYMPELLSWTGLHDYRPNLMLHLADRVFLTNGSLIEELNVGETGTYFGTTYDSRLDVVFNQNPLATKVADNLFIQSTACFDKIKVSNSFQESIETPINLITEYDYNMDLDVVARKINSNYQMNIPRSIEETRFKDKYNKVSLVVDNNKHNSFTVKYVTLLFRQNHR